MKRVSKRFVALGLGALVPMFLAATCMWLRVRNGGGDALDSVASSLSLKAGDTKRFEWLSQNKKHWQIQSSAPLEAPAQTEAREKTGGACSLGMVEVKGAFLVDSYGRDDTDEVESVQSKTCSTWINKDFPARCADFDADAWSEAKAPFKHKQLHFCIDRYEYPNQNGAYPWIVSTYIESSNLCKREGKRLCTESEWTLACEGEEGTPYPGAYEREAAACVTDQPWREFDSAALGDRNSSRAENEVDRLWQGEASGSRATCRSSYGVYDMTGNVDEWTTSVRKTGYRSVLKGGYWGPVRDRCRPATRAHNEQFVAYQQGFRCCSAVPDGEAREPEVDLEADASAPAPSVEPLGAADAASSEPAPDDAGFSMQAPLPMAADYGLLDEDEELGKKLRGVGRGCGAGPTK